LENLRRFRFERITPGAPTHTTRHEGYQVSQRKRKRIEEVFGWVKTVGMLRKTRHRGLETVAWVFTFTATAYNLVRMRNLIFQSV
jgi:hypothetical protein